MGLRFKVIRINIRGEIKELPKIVNLPGEQLHVIVEGKLPTGYGYGRKENIR